MAYHHADDPNHLLRFCEYNKLSYQWQLYSDLLASYYLTHPLSPPSPHTLILSQDRVFFNELAVCIR